MTSAASIITVAATITAIIAIPFVLLVDGGFVVSWLLFADGMTLSIGLSVVICEIEMSVDMGVVVSMAGSSA